MRLKGEEAGRVLIATRRGTKKRSDEGVEVRKIFHQLRSHSIENFNEQFKGIFDAHASVPTKGLAKTSLRALGCLFVYQLALLYRYESGQELRLGLKPFLKAA